MSGRLFHGGVCLIKGRMLCSFHAVKKELGGYISGVTTSLPYHIILSLF